MESKVILTTRIQTKRRFTAGKNKLQPIKENVICGLTKWLKKAIFKLRRKIEKSDC